MLTKILSSVNESRELSNHATVVAAFTVTPTIGSIWPRTSKNHTPLNLRQRRNLRCDSRESPPAGSNGDSSLAERTQEGRLLDHSPCVNPVTAGMPMRVRIHRILNRFNAANGTFRAHAGSASSTSGRSSR